MLTLLPVGLSQPKVLTSLLFTFPESGVFLVTVGDYASLGNHGDLDWEKAKNRLPALLVKR